jgi:hypothetical protein
LKTSFIRPRSKSALKRDTKFWITFIFLSTSVLLGLYGALQFEVDQTIENTKKAMLDRKYLSAEAVRLKNEHDSLKEELSFAVDIKTSNTLLKDNIANIFAIVPDQVTLTKVEINGNCMVLYGYTQSKEIFNLHLTPALKSIFTTSETSFASSGNGVKFISINKLDTPEKEDEDAGQ